MKHVLLVALFCCQSHLSYSAFERLSQGGRATALGGSPVALSGNEWSVFANPAALKSVHERILSACYTPQPFELEELSHGAVSFIEPTSFGTFALSASRFGFELYKETQLALSYSEDVAATIHAGVNLNYYALSIQNYGSASTVGVDVGMLVEISDAISWGFAAVNLNAAKIGEAKEKLPQVLRTGVSYSPIRSGTILMSLEKDIRYSATLHLGLEYELMDMIALRAGSSSDPNTMNLGVGIHYGFAQLDYAFSSHSELGVTHQFSVSLKLSDL